MISKNGESTWGPHFVFQKCGAQTNSPLCFAKMRSLFQLPNLFLQNMESAGTPHCAFEKYRVRVNSPFCFYKVWSLFEHSTVFLKNAEFTQTPPCLNSHSVFTKCRVQMNSLCLPKMWDLFQLPTCFYKMWSSHQLPTLFLQHVDSTSYLFLQNAESTGTPHPVSRKCGVHTNSPSVSSKNVGFVSTFNLFLQNAEFTSTPHPVFTTWAVTLNTPLCFWKMWSSHELPFCRVCLNSHSIFTKGRVCWNSPLCF